MLFSILIYNFIFVPIFVLLTKLLKPFIPKLKEREGNINKSLKNLDKLNKTEKIIWIHSASMGEFEQAKPIIEQLKSIYSNIQIVCTFFSPSGYNTQKTYKYADAISYLPFDSKRKVVKFINKINPNVAIFVRYELWLNYLTVLKQRNIPTILINATFPKIIKKISFLAFFYRNIFELFREIYIMSNKDYNDFLTLKLNTKLYKSSDTRFERIIEKVEEAKTKQILLKEYFPNNNIILVAGSTWKIDEEYIIDAVIKVNIIYNNIINLIIVPHEPNENNINRLKNKINKFILFSQIIRANENYKSIKIIDEVVIVDTIGILLKLYGIADIAYVGGSFGAGVHSLAEPAGYGIPICTGKNCFNSPDAIQLKEKQALCIIENASELEKWLIKIIEDKSFRINSGNAAKNYIINNAGATQQIIKAIEQYI